MSDLWRAEGKVKRLESELLAAEKARDEWKATAQEWDEVTDEYRRRAATLAADRDRLAAKVARVEAQCRAWSHGNSWNRAARNAILRALAGDGDQLEQMAAAVSVRLGSSSACGTPKGAAKPTAKIDRPATDDAATRWLRNYHGSIDSTALLLAFRAGQKAAIESVAEHG